MNLTDLHDKLSALLEDPARDLYAETIFTLASDYLVAMVPLLAEPPACHAPAGKGGDALTLIGQIARMKIDGEFYDTDGNLTDEAEAANWDLEPYLQENDDAVDTLGNLIRQARDITDSACRTPAAEGEEVIHWKDAAQLPDEDIMFLVRTSTGAVGEAYLDSGTWVWSGLGGAVESKVLRYADMPAGLDLETDEA